jgi:energy-coupling factor transporter ATP-binding protein EcfA2
MITHRVDYAAAYAHRAIVMNGGEVAFDGPVLDLVADVDKMRANALELPDVTKLALQLRKHGVPPRTIRYEQLEGYLRQLVENPDGD